MTKKTNQNPKLSNPSKTLIYQAKDGAIELSGDIKNIFLDKELDEKVVCANFAQTKKAPKNQSTSPLRICGWI